VLAAVRAAVYRGFAFPAFMGTALAEPRALLLLLLVPVLALGAMLRAQHGDLGAVVELMNRPAVTYSQFLRHGVLEGLFLAGNVVIFLFALVGFTRFYRGLRGASAAPPRLGFVAAALATLREIIVHGRFGTCVENRPRRLAHLLVSFGFVGAMATAGLALAYMIVWEHGHPGLRFAGLSLENPIKWLGVLSGVAMIGGSLLMPARRPGRDGAGARSYSDRLFLWMVPLVAASGLLTWLLRLAVLPHFAYPVYFAHLVLVFFLLWTMPYGKFSHMVYRALAVTWAFQTGRLPTAARS
jgi:quinone-modifying oxidoreductase subunit QmoC